MSCRSATILVVLGLAFVQLGQSKVTVVSTTCQYETDSGSLDWMTCPLNRERETPLTFRQFKDDLENSQNNQKFCCGEISQRFCCSLEEKLLEVPDFDPSKDDDDVEEAPSEEVIEVNVSWYDGFGFWSWLLFSTMCILLVGIIIYMASCIFVEILDMITYVICCCFCRGYTRKRKGYDEYEATGGKKKEKKGGKEYRPQHSQASSSSQLVTTTPSYVESGNYQRVEKAVPVHSYGGTYQNVTPSPPPSYKA